jgi:hypothetical protein
MTYHRDNSGNYSVVNEGLPVIAGVRLYDEGRYLCDCPPIYRREAVIKRDLRFKPEFEVYDRWNKCDMDYLFTEVETKTTKTRRDVFGNAYRQLVRKHRPVSTLRTELYLNY